MSRIVRTLHVSVLVLSLLLLASCGPIVAQVMRGGEGVNESAVLSGSGPAPKAGSRLVILSPFAKTKDSFYLCRGEDEEALAESFRSKRIFEAVAVHRRSPEEAASLAASLKGKGPAKAKEELALSFEPDAVVTGTILTRKTMVAPLRGVVMDVSYRLDFLDLRTGSTWSATVAVRTLAEESIALVAEEVGRLAASKR
jgi:hypothetical protein